MTFSTKRHDLKIGQAKERNPRIDSERFAFP